MDRLACNIIYVNRLVEEDTLIRAVPDSSDAVHQSSQSERKRELGRNLVKPLLNVFDDSMSRPLHLSSHIRSHSCFIGKSCDTYLLHVVHVCNTGAACLSTLFQLRDGSLTNLTPTLILLDTPIDDLSQNQYNRSTSSSPTSPTPAFGAQSFEIHTPNEELYGLNLLQKIITEAHLSGTSKLVVPVPIISSSEAALSKVSYQMTDGISETRSTSEASLTASRRLIRACLDMGAVDVLFSPLTSNCITALEICAYRAHRDATKEQQAVLEVSKGRKRSWVGVNEQKPFAYLREAMVSGLMNGICRLDGSEAQIMGARIAVSSQRQAEIAAAVGRWHFCAHSFSDDELLVAALVMFEHALAVPELEPWRIPTGGLTMSHPRATCDLIIC